MYEDEPGIKIAGYPLTGIIRQVRRRADFSQRELARWAHLSPAAIGAIESGRLTPSVPTLQRLLNAANCQLVVVDANGRMVVPLMVWDAVADLAGRRFPARNGGRRARCTAEAQAGLRRTVTAHGAPSRHGRRSQVAKRCSSTRPAAAEWASNASSG